MFVPGSANATFLQTPDGEIMNVDADCLEYFGSKGARIPIERTSIYLTYIPYSRKEFESGNVFVLDRPNQQPYIQDLDGSVWCGGIENPLEISTLVVQPTKNSTADLVVAGKLDFRCDALAALGNPTFTWRIQITQFDSP